MRICAGITYMVLGEAPDMSSVDDEVRQHWNSLSIETARLCKGLMLCNPHV